MVVLPLFVLLVQGLMVEYVECGGTIAVQIHSFRNPGGRDSNDNCCDGISLPDRCPTGSCDNEFTLCVSSKNSTTVNGVCDFGKQMLIGPRDQNSNNFTETDTNRLTFQTWPGMASIAIGVADQDADGEAEIDSFSLEFNSPISLSASALNYTNYQLTGARQKNPTSLSVSVAVYCDKYYYGDDCSSHCVSQDDCSGHYKCNSTGHLVCNQGWRGDNCNQLIPGSLMDCSGYHENSVWEGNMTCNNTVQNASLYFSGNGGISGSLIYKDETFHVSGIFNVTTSELLLKGDNSSHDVISNISLVAPRGSFSSLNGTVVLNGEYCDIKLEESYVSPCGDRGTCVRYGGKAQDYYCCCQDGMSGGQFCPTTILPTTTTITTSTPTTTPMTSTTIPTTTLTTNLTTPGATSFTNKSKMT